jgi:flagellar basal body-associated protein FliL
MAARRVTQARKETRAIWVFIAIVALMMILASYGYFTGAWNNATDQERIETGNEPKH